MRRRGKRSRLATPVAPLLALGAWAGAALGAPTGSVGWADLASSEWARGDPATPVFDTRLQPYGRNQYQFVAWPVGPAEELVQFEAVEYRLPDSYANPRRRVGRGDGFALTDKVWGNFDESVPKFTWSAITVRARAHYPEGRVSEWVGIPVGPGQRPLPSGLSVSMQRSRVADHEGLSLALEGDEGALAEVRTVEYRALGGAERAPVTKGQGQDFAATLACGPCVEGVRVTVRWSDGRITPIRLPAP